MSGGVSGAGRSGAGVDVGATSGSSGSMPAIGAAGASAAGASAAGAAPTAAELKDPAFAGIAAGTHAALHVGDRGAAVKGLQEALIRLGKLPPGSADGVFGRGTERALSTFQREKGLTPDGRLGKQSLATLDKALADGTTRAPAAPAPDPLRRPPGSYLSSEAERKAYDFCKDKLFTGASWRNGIDLAVTNEDALAIMDRLETLPPASYNRVLHALAATKENDARHATLLDKLIVRGTSQFGNVSLSARFCEQLEKKYTPLGASAETKIFSHISPDSVRVLQAWAGWNALRNLIM